MEDKLCNFFLEKDFEIKEPRSGHLERFLRKLFYIKRAKKNYCKKPNSY